jgi:hypothetical protein
MKLESRKLSQRNRGTKIHPMFGVIAIAAIKI